MKQEISIAIGIINKGLLSILSILFLLLFGMLLSLYIAKSMPINANTLGLLNASFQIILVFVTAIYVILTGKIITQTGKNNRIIFIEKRLEKLYYPLRDILQNPFTDVFIGGEKVKNINLKKIDDIIPFQYLASKELENPLNEFIKKALDERYIYGHEVGYDYKPYEIVDDGFKKKVDEDIENFKNELKELVK